MKKIFLLSLLTISILFSMPTKELINTLVEEIKPDRIGLSSNVLNVIRNPFVSTESGKVSTSTVVRRYSHGARFAKRKPHFKLYATLNKSAKINNRWVSLNEKVSHYTLKKITKEYVVMQKGTSQPITIYLNRKNKKINIMTK